MSQLYNIKRNIFALCLLAAMIFGVSTPAKATLNGEWKHHAGMAYDSHYKETVVQRIIDGNRYVYYCVRGLPFSRRNLYLFSTLKNFDPIQIFRYDKTQPWSGDNIVALSQCIDAGGYIVETVNYSPRLGALTVIYDNRNIDIIFDDGRVVKSKALSDLKLPAPAINTPYSITYDLENPEMYIGAGFGYLRLDVNTGEAIEYVKLDKNVTWACRYGDQMVVIAGDEISHSSHNTTAYIFNFKYKPSKLSGYELRLSEDVPDIPLNSNKSLVNPEAMMPLTNNSFVALLPYQNEIGYQLIWVKTGPPNSAKVLVKASSFDNGSNAEQRHRFRSDGRYNETNDGYLLVDNAYFVFIDRAGNMKRVLKQGMSNNDTFARYSSVDGKTFYTHANDGVSSTSDITPKGFLYRTFTDDGNPVFTSETVLPNCPTALMSGYISYHPVKGLLFRGPGAYLNTAGDRDFLCSYKDGRWTDLSYEAFNPIYTPIMEHNKGIAIDPVNPDWIWSSSMNGGLFRTDLSDYGNFLAFGNEKRTNEAKLYPGFYNVIPDQPFYSGSANFSSISFDNDGTMWFAHDLIFDFPSAQACYEGAYVPLMYLTADERLSMANVTDKSQLVMPHEIRVPHANTDRHDQTLALLHERNKNLIVHTSAYFNYDWMKCFVYDHNGTLADTSDDRFVLLEDLVDEKGDKFHYEMEYCVYEDPETGNIWFGTWNGLIVFDPHEMLAGSKKITRFKITRRDGMDVEEYPFEQVAVNEIKHDNMGRKWLATESGVYCVSKDGQELLAHFTTDNSPLPSNEVYATGCDEASGAVFISTETGIMEFRPENYASADLTASELSIWPRNVNPHYNGYVNVYGVMPGLEYVVSDASGNEIVSLGKSSDGTTLQWNCRDASGAMVAPGKYGVASRGSEVSKYVYVVK